MPNLVANNVIVSGPDEAIGIFLARCFRVVGSDGDEPNFDFEAVVPSGTPEESAEDEAAEHDDRRRCFWGTKWDAWDTMILVRDVGYLQFEFMTASNCPEPIYRELGRAFPTLAFDIAALEPGMWWAVTGHVQSDNANFDETVDPRSIYERIYKQLFDGTTD